LTVLAWGTLLNLAARSNINNLLDRVTKTTRWSAAVSDFFVARIRHIGKHDKTTRALPIDFAHDKFTVRFTFAELKSNGYPQRYSQDRQPGSIPVGYCGLYQSQKN